MQKEDAMKNQIKYWDSVANTKDFTVPIDFNLFSKYVKKNALILDIGCGYGRILNELNLKGYKNLTGTDFSKQMIDRGNKLFPGIKMKVINDKSPFDDNYFDVVILFATLTCIENNEKQKEIISNIRNILKPNGIIYIIDFLLNDDPRNIDRYKQFQSKYKNYGTFENKNGGVFRHHKKEWIDELLNIFSVIEYQETVYKTMNGNTSNAFSFFGRNIVK